MSTANLVLTFNLQCLIQSNVFNYGMSMHTFHFTLFLFISLHHCHGPVLLPISTSSQRAYFFAPMLYVSHCALFSLCLSSHNICSLLIDYCNITNPPFVQNFAEWCFLSVQTISMLQKTNKSIKCEGAKEPSHSVWKKCEHPATESAWKTRAPNHI